MQRNTKQINKNDVGNSNKETNIPKNDDRNTKNLEKKKTI